MHDTFPESFVSKVKKTALTHEMFPPGITRIMVGLSGGADSVCLAYALNQLKDDLGINVCAAHLNHCIRGAESDCDEDFSKAFASKHDMDFYSERIDVPALHMPGGPSLEQLCREQRLAFYQRAKTGLGAHRIALAHSKSDQVETFLMRLARGSSLRGLAAMDYVNGDIVRPLLDASGAQIREFCNSLGLEFRVDSTNANQDFTRNRIRHRLMPILENEFNPEIEERLFATARLIRKDSDFIEKLADNAFWDALAVSEEKRICLGDAKLAAMPDPILSRVLLIAYYRVIGRGFITLEQKHINEMMRFARRGASGDYINLPGRARIEKTYDAVTLSAKPRPETTGFLHEITLPEPDKTRTFLFDNPPLKFHFEFRNIVEEEMLRNTDETTAYIDASKLHGPLSIRNRCDGDRFFPLGMKDSRKLQDFFTDKKVPAEARDRVPLLVCANEIVWVAGYRLDDRFKITTSTGKVLVVKSEYCEKTIS